METARLGELVAWIWIEQQDPKLLWVLKHGEITSVEGNGRTASVLILGYGQFHVQLDRLCRPDERIRAMLGLQGLSEPNCWVILEDAGITE
jgi:hypothetical protein